MLVCHLTSVHRPDDIRIFRKECVTLAGHGHEVHLVAPHGGSWTDPRVRLHAVRPPADRTERFLRTRGEVLDTAEALKADVYHFHDPELLAGAARLRRAGARVVYDSHESVPNNILEKRWVPAPLRRPLAAMVGAYELRVARSLDAIVAATPAIARRFDPARTVVVQNFPLPGELVVAAELPYAERPRMFAYVGGLQPLRGIPQMVDALALLSGAPGVRLSLAGTFTDLQVERDAKGSPGWRGVDELGWVDRAGVARLLGEARAGLVLFQPAPNHVESQPNKLFEYMSAGVPVIASNFPMWREVVEGVGCGICVDPDDPKAIAGAFDRILADPAGAAAMGARGKAAVAERFNWPTEAAKLLALYQRLGVS